MIEVVRNNELLLQLQVEQKVKKVEVGGFKVRGVSHFFLFYTGLPVKM